MIKLTAIIDDGDKWNELPIIFNTNLIFAIMPSDKLRYRPIIGSEDNTVKSTEVWMQDGNHWWVKETVDEIWASMSGK